MAYMQNLRRAEAAAAADTWVYGRIKVLGNGEVRVPIGFPVTYIGKPFPIRGCLELDLTETASFGAYPECDVTVVDWQVEYRPDGDLYKGATLAIVMDGRDGQDAWVTYSFVGRALANGGS